MLHFFRRRRPIDVPLSKPRAIALSTAMAIAPSGKQLSTLTIARDDGSIWEINNIDQVWRRIPDVP